MTGNLDGEITLIGRLLDASNATFLVKIQRDDDVVDAVYKPVAGEKPLWDFPANTLGHREIAAAVLSREAGFGVVPETAWVTEAPLGPGMVQRWVNAGADAVVDIVASDQLPRSGWFEIFAGLDDHEQAVSVIHADDPGLRTIALFDAIINNSDRKGGHILKTDAAIYGIDHGVSFHVEPKLRTLLWGWAGTEFSAAEVDLLARAGAAVVAIEEWLTGAEIAALSQRIENLRRAGHFPTPERGWPTLPWPVW